MDSDLVSTIVLYAPGVAVLLWTVIQDRKLIDKLTDRCIVLQDRDRVASEENSTEKNQVLDN